jgi:sulfate adenylyltransferase subunit 1
LKVGDRVTVLPSENETHIKSIQLFDQEYEEAVAGSSITITLENEVDLSRGDMLVKSEAVPRGEKQISATICQVNSKALKVGNKYLLQHGVNRVLAKVDQIESLIHPDFSGSEAVDQLKLNDIGRVKFKLSKPIHVDSYHVNKSNGAFILIDESSFDTVSIGFIE